MGLSCKKFLKAHQEGGFSLALCTIQQFLFSYLKSLKCPLGHDCFTDLAKAHCRVWSGVIGKSVLQFCSELSEKNQYLQVLFLGHVCYGKG